MPYAEGRTFYDADSHVMELPEWLGSYADPGFRDRMPTFSLASSGTRARVEEMIARGRSRAGVESERAAHEAELLTRKSWDAYGAFHADDRRRALDELGFHARAAPTSCDHLLDPRARAAARQRERRHPVAESGVGMAAEPFRQLHHVRIGVVEGAALGVRHACD